MLASQNLSLMVIFSFPWLVLLAPIYLAGIETGNTDTELARMVVPKFVAKVLVALVLLPKHIWILFGAYN